MLSELVLALAVCVATSNSTNAALKKDFEEKGCQSEGTVKATMKEEGDLLEITMGVDVVRGALKPNPMRTVMAANTAQKVLEHVKTFYTPKRFRWNVNDVNDLNICTITITQAADGVNKVEGNCAGAGKLE